MSLMKMSGLLALGGETLRDPRGAARRLLSLQLPDRTCWEALALIVVVTGLYSGLVMLTVPQDPDVPPYNPVPATLIQAGVVALGVYAMHHVGRSFGGTGRLGAAVLLMAWLQAVILMVQLVLTLILILLPPLAGLVVIGAAVLIIWLVTQFVMELHGFESTFKVLAGVLATMVGLGFIFSILIAPLM